MSYLLEHTKFGFCWLDLLALIVLIVVVVFFIKKNTKLKDEQKDLEDQLSDLYADDSLDAEEADGTSDTQTQDAAESQTDDGQTAENQ